MKALPKITPEIVYKKYLSSFGGRTWYQTSIFLADIGFTSYDRYNHFESRLPDYLQYHLSQDELIQVYIKMDNEEYTKVNTQNSRR